uniref:Uncharacterized protein n=1 Tax=Eutreptiella gymnastica TaxID=73025 RepID=A0A7S4D1Z3_9EUGL
MLRDEGKGWATDKQQPVHSNHFGRGDKGFGTKGKWIVRALPALERGGNTTTIVCCGCCRKTRFATPHAACVPCPATKHGGHCSAVCTALPCNAMPCHGSESVLSVLTKMQTAKAKVLNIF